MAKTPANRPNQSGAKPIKRPKGATLQPAKKAKAAAPKTVVAKASTPKKVTPKKIVPVVPMEVSKEERMETPKVKEKAKLPVAEKRTDNYFYANGKRKTAIAMVRLYTNGKGTVTINERTFENYFPLFIDKEKILAPLKMTNANKTFDISARVIGGGVHSQAEAIRHAVSKALLLFNPEFRITLKHAGFLTRDSRVKERKKYGLKRARRAPQFSKR